MARSKKNKFSRKYLLISLLVITIVLASCGLFILFQQSQKHLHQLSSVSLSNSEIKNWKTYKNIPYGFSVKYPNTWTDGEYAPNGTTDIYIISLGEKFTPYNELHPAAAGIVITIFKPGFYMGDIDGKRTYLKEDTDLIQFMNIVDPDAKQQSLYIGNIKAISYKYKNGVESDWYFKKYNNIYQINLISSSRILDKEKLLATFDYILNSFKFD